jgi:nucleotide-binding universal stress UspA family protein
MEPTAMQNDDAQSIVVGIDGSDGAERALRWAVVHAARVGARVVAVEAWSVPKLGTLLDVMESEDVEDVGTVVLNELERAMARARGAAGIPDSVDIEARAVEGQAVSVLIEQARNAHASLLVVGSRGRGGFAGLLLGSVSAALAHHAPCALVIVPPPAS